MNRSLTSAQIYDGEYFDIVSSEGDILVVRCNICNPEGTDASQLLRTSTKSNGNILKHIKRRHGELLEKIKMTKSVKSRAPRIKVDGEHNSSGQIQCKKQRIDSDEEYEEKLISQDSTVFNTSDGMYVIEPIQCDPTDSEQEEYVEIDGDDTMEDYEQLDGTEYELIHTAKRKRLNPLNVVRSNDSNATAVPLLSNAAVPDKSIIELQKRLLQAEHDEIIKQRAEKHQLEISILKAELAHKTMEHQKRMEILSKQLSEASK